MRILPEWKGYDDEVRELQKKIDSGVLDDDPAAEAGGVGRNAIEEGECKK